MSCQNGAGEKVYRYNGKEWDEEIGLYAYGFRYYDPAIARFTGVDPIADKFASLSVYNYADNSPIANIDLHGLQKYYTADGSYLTRNGTSEEKRVLNENIEIGSEGNYDYDYFPNNSSEILTREGVDQAMESFVKNYQNADVEHLQIFGSKIFDDKDGSIFKGYIAGSIVSGDEESVSVSASILPSGWRKEISIHNHPNPNRHRFSKAQPGGTFGSAGLEGDYYIGVAYQMDMFLTTKNNTSILMFDHRKFYKFLKEDYRSWNNTFRGQKVEMGDMNKFGPKSVREYYFSY